jgi:hypothetical protein
MNTDKRDMNRFKNPVWRVLSKKRCSSAFTPALAAGASVCG